MASPAVHGLVWSLFYAAKDCLSMTKICCLCWRSNAAKEYLSMTMVYCLCWRSNSAKECLSTTRVCYLCWRFNAGKECLFMTMICCLCWCRELGPNHEPGWLQRVWGGQPGSRQVRLLLRAGPEARQVLFVCKCIVVVLLCVFPLHQAGHQVGSRRVRLLLRLDQAC